MSYRFTNSDKWTDSWFSDLSPHAKLLFIFLYENCDNAGLYEVNRKFMLFLLGFTDDELKDAIKELGKSYIKSNDGTKIWLKNFLKHQKLYPLNWKNNAHKQIINILLENLADENKFKGCKELESIIPELPKEKAETIAVKKVEEKPKRKRRTTKFVKPTEEEIFNVMQEKDFPPAKTEAKRFWNWFESNGWKVGKNPMKSWKGAVNTWMINWYERNNITNKSKMDNVRESHESLEGVDWNKVYKTENV